jgi:phage-related protein
VWEHLKKWGKDSFTTISTNFKANIEQIKSDVDSTKSAVKQKLQGVGEWFKTNISEPVKSWAKSAGESVAEAADNAKSAVKQKLQNVGEWFKSNVFEPVKARAKEGFAAIASTSAANIQQMKADWNGVKETMSQHLQAIRQAGSQAFSAMQSVGAQAGNAIRSAFQNA